MEFTVSKTELLTKLQHVGKIISAKPSLPITSNFLFEIENDELCITAADLLGYIQTSMKCITDIEKLSICVDAKMLLDSLKVLPEQPVLFIIDDLNVCIKYSGGKFEMMGKETKTFPNTTKFKELGKIELTCATFLFGLQKTQFCSSDDELRPVLTSVFIELKDKYINYIASNGHRLALLKQKVESTEDISFMLPKKIAGILKSIVPSSDSSLLIKVGATTVSIMFNDYIITAHLLEGRYPNYRSVIPDNNNKTMNINTTALKSAISRVSVFSSQSTKVIKMSLGKNLLIITGKDIDYSTNAEEKLDCESDCKIDIGFNSVFLSEIISNIIDTECTMSFSDPSRAALVSPSNNDEDEELTYLLMPMTIYD